MAQHTWQSTWRGDETGLIWDEDAGTFEHWRRSSGQPREVSTPDSLPPDHAAREVLEMWRDDDDAPDAGGGRRWGWERDGDRGAVLHDSHGHEWQLTDFRRSRADFLALMVVSTLGIPESLLTPDDEIPDGHEPRGYGWVYGATMPNSTLPPGEIG